MTHSLTLPSGYHVIDRHFEAHLLGLIIVIGTELLFQLTDVQKSNSSPASKKCFVRQANVC